MYLRPLTDIGRLLCRCPKLKKAAELESPPDTLALAALSLWVGAVFKPSFEFGAPRSGRIIIRVIRYWPQRPNRRSCDLQIFHAR